jgi:hypothetical protein
MFIMTAKPAQSVAFDVSSLFKQFKYLLKLSKVMATTAQLFKRETEEQGTRCDEGEKQNRKVCKGGTLTLRANSLRGQEKKKTLSNHYFTIIFPLMEKNNKTNRPKTNRKRETWQQQQNSTEARSTRIK